MTWADGPMLAFDCESTGVDVFTDRIVTATVVRIEPGAEPKVRSTVINPGVEVPDAAAEVHGFTTARVQAEGLPPALELEWIAADLTEAFRANTAVVIANAPFDLSILDAELSRHGLATLADRLQGHTVGPVIDPMCIDKALDKYRPGKRTLTDLAAFYGVKLDGAHDATADALAVARLAWRMGQRARMTPADIADAFYSDRPRQAMHIGRGFARLGGLSLADLHVQQVIWYADKARDFGSYLRQQANEAEHNAERSNDNAERTTLLADAGLLRDRADDVSTEWPIRTAVAA